MFRSHLLPIAFAIAVSAFAQTKAGGNIAAQSKQFQAALAQAPKLAVAGSPIDVTSPGTPWEMGTVASVAMSPSGAIYILQRGDKADPVIVVNQEGRILRSWGKGMFGVPHSIRFDPDGNVWTVDAGNSVLQKFTPEGKKLQEISVGEVATGAKCAFPTLCGTTDVTFGPDGRLFISDGYGNARILEYSADGKRARAWGSAGSGPGQFNIPHGIAFDGKGVLFVADRGNARIQRFDLEGHYLGQWTNLGRPFALKFKLGFLWIAGQSLQAEPDPTGKAKGGRTASWLLKVDPASGKILGKSEAPGPHSIDASSEEEFVASGCCGGLKPTAAFFFRNTR